MINTLQGTARAFAEHCLEQNNVEELLLALEYTRQCGADIIHWHCDITLSEWEAGLKAALLEKLKEFAVPHANESHFEKASFELDDVCDCFDGWNSSLTQWSTHATPFFELSAALSVMAAINDADDSMTMVIQPDATLIVDDPEYDFHETIALQTVNTEQGEKHVYCLALDWCWRVA
ncbi:hypothetical protein [Kistimonas asteriae]|uniref:hypothetical protein n=1 Tax=Kistimonas asteriae TaxID=517724 RepID=UPI001BA47596|nr:hypothetical protein [Kistimonas asteriae]